jgi:phosphoserine phosphatase
LTKAQPGISSEQFIQSVLNKRPAIAVFDCDGTLWAGDSGADFFYWEIEQKLIPPAIAEWVLGRYDGYKNGQVDEYTICAEMVTIHKGLSIAAIREAVQTFFAERIEHRIFPEMLELTHQLAAQGTEIWAVSSTNDWVVEEGAKRFGIPANRVLAACVNREPGSNGSCECAGGNILRVPTDEHKAIAIREVIQRPVDAVFGNSVHDFAMLEIARDAYAINPNPDLETAAAARDWTIYWPRTSAKAMLK